MFKYLVVFLFIFGSVVAQAPGLRQREPHWRPLIVEHYPDGQPLRILFYEQVTEENEAPVKQVIFYPNGQVHQETDLTVISEEESAATEWKSTIVPHGIYLVLSAQGEVERVSTYDRGVLHGEMKLFYPGNKLKGQCIFNKGKREGSLTLFFEDGSKLEESTYQNGVLVGESVRYFPNGTRERIVPYQEGLPHGNLLEWYQSGILKASYYYQKGKLHSNGTTPAVVRYTEERAISECQDFSQGEPIGIHVRYYPNGKESYKVLYKNGKKQGKEQFFGEEGTLLGEGEYKEGVPHGKHWRNNPTGTPLFLASYDGKGNPLGPVEEFSELGVKVAQYFLKDGQKEGSLFLWYPDGKVSAEYRYEKGQYEGEQREFFPNGQIKVRAHYVAGVKDGSYEQWHDNGKLAVQAMLKQGEKEGEAKEWYPDGQLHLFEIYSQDRLHGLKQAWFSNGQLQFQGEFCEGKKIGTHREYDELGVLLAEVPYQDDLLSGVVKRWYSKEQLKEVYHLHLGKKEGMEESYYPNGKLASHAFYKNDLPEGETKTWYEDGTLCSIKNFRQGVPVGENREYFPKEKLPTPVQQLSRQFFYDDAGKMDGEQKTYYPEGSLHTLTTYLHGELNGRKALWGQDGKLLEEANYEKNKLFGRFFERASDGKEVIYHYKNNRREGLHEVYYPSHEYFGRVKALELNFVNHQPEGEAVEYNEEGKKIAVTRYHNGKKEGLAEVFSHDRIALAIPFHEDKKEGVATQYFPDGSVYKQSSFANDLLEGEEKVFFKGGKLAKQVPYHQGKIHGLYQEWNEQGTLVFEGEYCDGKKSGKFNKYYSNGKPALLQTFVDDLLDGVKTSFDPDGNAEEVRYSQGKRQ